MFISRTYVCMRMVCTLCQKAVHRLGEKITFNFLTSVIRHQPGETHQRKIRQCKETMAVLIEAE